MKKIRDRAKLKAAIKRRKKAVYDPVQPQQQLGFVHNNVDCIGCRACEIACKDKNGLPAGPRFRRVQYIEGGTYPDVFAYKVNMSCNHCAEPACLPACPTGAIWKDGASGTKSFVVPFVTRPSLYRATTRRSFRCSSVHIAVTH